MAARSLLLTTSFPPTLGGLETLLYQTNRRLARPPLVLAPHPASAPDLVVQPVATTPRGLLGRATYRAVWRLHPSLHYSAAFLRPLLAALRGWRPRVLQVGHVYLAPLARLVARRAGLPYVVYVHGQEVWRGGRPAGVMPLDARLRGAALRQAAAVFAAGGFSAGLARDWGVAEATIVRVPFGADPVPTACPAPGRARLLSVCRLVSRKGVDTVIRALPRIASTHPAVTYHVVGAGPDEPRLRALARDLGVADRVRFLGRVDEATLHRAYRDCDLFVLPCRRTGDGSVEGYGLVYFEAAARGRAVLAGRSGGEVDAVVDGETGVLVDGDSVDAVAGAGIALLADPERLRRLGANGRRRVETTHNWTQAAAVVDRTLDRLAA
jgi:phosphatidylinositol alpha-1,6-mannosyltransferase